MMYKVLETFSDIKDHGYIYAEGDEYPREGMEPDEKRISELSTSKNLLHKPLIREAREERKPRKKKAAEEE